MDEEELLCPTGAQIATLKAFALVDAQQVPCNGGETTAGYPWCHSQDANSFNQLGEWCSELISCNKDNWS